ncbi:MAG TPA: biosynthetic peptidoglycan transglycosylase, partial [Thermoanaerobaculia bacterium]|nr:biosynthetic peptidoglycan transglycosylase [Thermoanaerobaculia bacterium]
LDALLAVARGGAPVGRLGRVSGRVAIGADDAGGLAFDLLAIARGARVAAVVEDETGERRELGAPTDVELAASGSLVPAWHRVQLACFRLESSGVSMKGDGAVEEGADDVWADIGIDVPRFELAPVVAASGLRLDLEDAPLPSDLGSATLTAELSGHLLDPDSIRVEQKLVFHRPAGGVPALAYLNGPFTHVVELEERDVKIEVRPGAPDYVALEDVPPLFLRALTISEDAAFWGHPGVDLSEIPIALATNWKRGERARGGSTITQQLVKNLFLSRRKSYGRKLQEAALALLVESAVPKRRILEIYLNVIEWGPGLYGLRPAARHYFGKEPRDLTPKETAFLVSIIPGPIKYQRSFAGGALSPRFAPLVTGVLAKLRSVDAISDEEYEKALAEPLDFAFTRPEGPPFEPD